MKALTTRERRIMQVAMAEADKQSEDIAKRAQYIWAIAMIKYGKSPKTVNGVKNLVAGDAERYADYRTDKLADFAFHSKLEEAGCDCFEMTENEL